MVKWQVVYTKQAQKDTKKISASGLKEKAAQLIAILQKNRKPLIIPPT